MHKKLAPYQSEFQKSVHDFMEVTPQHTPDNIQVPPDHVKIARAKMLMEELLELIQGGLGMSVLFTHPETGEVYAINPEDCSYIVDDSCDLIQLIDGSIDLQYVAKGAMVEFGIPDQPFIDEVCNNNLTKVTPMAVVKEGKIQKPEGYKPPDILGIYNNMLNEIAE